MDKTKLGFNPTDIISEALAAREFSYCPYSQYAVGAALMTENGVIYQGCNIENAAYGECICAERTAVCRAVARGDREFKAIAIAGGPKGQDPTTYAFPCGSCRQVLSEFSDGKLAVIVAISETDYEVYELKELLPNSFNTLAMKS